MASEPKKGCLAKALCYPVVVFSQCLNPPRLSQDSILYWYIPFAGGASYTAFSIHIFNPKSLASLFPNGNHMVANMLLFNTHLGAGLYLFNRRHLALAPTHYRLMYSVYGAVIFNFGSILLWALSKVVLPENAWVRGSCAVSASLAMLLIGREYVNYVDSKIKK
uniref:Uncharacterized protein n=1 Tax=Strigamia maritima TaxID=126957 RepID=T1IXS2_STRMM